MRRSKHGEDVLYMDATRIDNEGARERVPTLNQFTASARIVAIA